MLVADGSIPLASKELTETEIKDDIPLRAFNAIIPVLTVIVMVIVGLYINGHAAVMAGDDTALIEFVKANPLSLSVLDGKVSAGIIPMAVFLLGCIIAFSTGTSWGTTAILMPIAVPLVYQLSGGDTGTILFATIGAVFTGAVFGDHCSPISDTTIMSSMASASDHIDHVKTQIPYSLTCAVIALLVGYLPAAIFGMNPFLSLIIGLGLAFTVVRLYGKEVEAPEFMREDA